MNSPASTELPTAPASTSAVPLADDRAAAEHLVKSYGQITAEMGKFIVGQHDVIEQLVIAVLAGGHCLLEGVPGLAKTAMIRSLSRTMDLSFGGFNSRPT
jgi:MoxR-like ATPase